MDILSIKLVDLVITTIIITALWSVGHAMQIDNNKSNIKHTSKNIKYFWYWKIFPSTTLCACNTYSDAKTVNLLKLFHGMKQTLNKSFNEDFVRSNFVITSIPIKSHGMAASQSNITGFWSNIHAAIQLRNNPKPHSTHHNSMPL